MIIVQNKRSGLVIPLYGQILYFGTAASIPTGWTIDTAASGAFVRGCDAGQGSDTLAGASTHSHTNPSTTAAASNHSHSLSGSVGSASGTAVTNDETYKHDNFSRQTHTHTLGGSVSGASPAHTLSSTGSPTATTLPPYNRLYWLKATKNNQAPVGGVILWSGTAATIPPKYYLCNGSNGTPDLRAKFIYGASSDSQIGTTGGAATHAHTNASTGTVSTHTHTLSPTIGAASGYYTLSVYNKGSAKHSHTHTVSVTSNSGGSHSHTLGNTGTATNIPAYIRLYYIMRGA